jgi:hypothetical protein
LDKIQEFKRAIDEVVRIMREFGAGCLMVFPTDAAVSVYLDRAGGFGCSAAFAMQQYIGERMP